MLSNNHNDSTSYSRPISAHTLQYLLASILLPPPSVSPPYALLIRHYATDSSDTTHLRHQLTIDQLTAPQPTLADTLAYLPSIYPAPIDAVFAAITENIHLYAIVAGDLETIISKFAPTYKPTVPAAPPNLVTTPISTRIETCFAQLNLTAINVSNIDLSNPVTRRILRLGMHPEEFPLNKIIEQMFYLWYLKLHTRINEACKAYYETQLDVNSIPTHAAGTRSILSASPSGETEYNSQHAEYFGLYVYGVACAIDDPLTQIETIRTVCYRYALALVSEMGSIRFSRRV